MGLIEDAQIAVKKLICPIVTCYANEYPPEKLKEDGKKLYPHTIFSFQNAAPNNEYSDRFLLQIDLWNNKGGDASEIETLTDAVFHALNKKKIMTDSLFFEIYRDTIFRLSLPDPDVNIQRRQLKFIAKIYEKEQCL